MHYFITGGSGFIGSHLVDKLIQKGSVTVYDNLSSGKKDYLKQHFGKKNFKFIQADLLNRKTLKRALDGSDLVFHLAANPDIRTGEKSPQIDFRQGTVATYNLLEAMRLSGVKKIVFSSSSTVFGVPTIWPTPEDYGPMQPISIYGASKLSCEGMVSAYAHMFDMQSWIFRFANIVGKRATHGIIIDLVKRLKRNPKNLEVLGDGNQKKSYLLVEDCVDAMLFAFQKAQNTVNLFNLGTADTIKVSEIVQILIKKSGLKKVKINYTGGRQGWRGDVPLMLLDIKKLSRLGWKTKYNSRQAIEKAIADLIAENHIRF